jgi:anti-anti-sigma regulatory factor
MHKTQQPVDERGLVVFEGDLTLIQAEEMKQRLLRALTAGDAVTIRFGSVGDLDLSCLQLLCSAHRSAKRLGKPLCIDGEIPSPLREAADAGGFSRVMGCKYDNEKTCLWTVVAGANHG